MSKVILACTSLTKYIAAAQEACGTDYPVIEVEGSYYVEPKAMKEKVLAALNALPEDVDTVLAAMGFCGGAWQDVVIPNRRLIIPRVDDCISMMMTVTEDVQPDRKELGHIYVYDNGDKSSPVQEVMKSLRDKYDEDMAEILFDMYFEHYHHLDIIDNGLYDCYDPAYVDEAQRDADKIKAELGFTEGSNLLLEKLVSGRWDGQFLQVEPGTKITQGTFFDLD